MAKDTWRNRIVGEGEEAPDQLLANPMNWRTHPKRQREALSGLLKEVGWVQRVIVNQTTGHIVDGHARVELAINRRETAVPVVYVELTPDEERLVLASLDPLGAMAGANKDTLDELLNNVQTSDAALQTLLQDTISATGMQDFDAAMSALGKEHSGLRQMTFMVTEEQHVQITSALKKAGKLLENAPDENANTNGNALWWLACEFNK